jgi:hypothetical protein
MRPASARFELELKLIMRRAVASALCLGLLALPLGAAADDASPARPRPDQATSSSQANADAPMKRPAVAEHDPLASNTGVGPVAITAKRTHARLDLRLSSERLNRVLNESGVEPVAETDADVDTVEVTAHHVQQEPITQGIPALYYGITHPTEAWRIFAPIQP